MKLDSQLLSMYQRCPRSYYYRATKGIVLNSPNKNALSTGTAFHKLFELQNNLRVNGMSLKEAVKIVYGDIWDLGIEIEELKGFQTDELLFITKRWMEYNERYSTDDANYDVVAVEKGFSVPMGGHENHVYEGRIDVVLRDKRTGQYLWRDYKTNSGQTLYPHTNQFYGYTYALGQLVENDDVYGQVDYIGKQKTVTSNTFIRENITFRREQLKTWVEETSSTFFDMEENIDGFRLPRNLTSCDGKYGKCQFTTLCERPFDIEEQLISMNYKKEEWKAW